MSIGAAAGIYSLTVSVAEATGKFVDLSQQTGFSVETLSGLSNAAETSGGSINTVVASLGLFETHMQEAKEKGSEMQKLFKALNIDTTDHEKALRQALKALQSLSTAEEKAAAGKKLFGRSYRELLAATKEAGDLDAFLNDQLRRGTLITTEAAERGDRLSDSVTEMGRAFDLVRRIVADEFGPDVLNVVQSITSMIEDNRGTIKSWITDWTTYFRDAVSGTVALANAILQLNDSVASLAGIETPEILKILSFLSPGGLSGLAAIGRFLRSSQPPNPVGLPVNDLQSLGGDFLSRPLHLPSGGGKGGAKAQQDILQGLKTSLIALNAEWRKYDVALLDSANSTALAAEKEKLLNNVMSSLKSETRKAISGLRDVDEAIEKAIGSLPKKSQAAARALVEQSLAQFKQNETLRIAGETTKKAEDLLRGWRTEIDNTRSGTDEYTRAISDLETAYSKYSVALDAGTKRELESLAAQQRLLKVTRERTVVMNQVRQRIVSGDVVRDLGEGSFVFRSDAVRDRIATIEEQVFRDRLEMRRNEMREVAEDLGAMFGDVFGEIGQKWEDLWSTMKNIALSISRSLIQELATGLFSHIFNVPFESRSGGIVGLLTNGIFNRQQPAITNLGAGSVFVPGGTGETRPRVAGARALGGPVDAGLLYRVNERGQEYFRPNIGGQVIPLGQQPQKQPDITRITIVDDMRSARETNGQIYRLNKRMRKTGKLVPMFK